MRYPESRRSDCADTLHGQSVPDPYRWLEDVDSAETADWVARQRAFGEQYLGELRERAWFRATLDRVLSRPRAGLPFMSGPLWFVTRNDGAQDQDVWFVADSLEELRDGGRVFVDPNEWSVDGTTSLAGVAVSRDGRYAALSRSDAGSDWHHVHVVEVATMTPVGEPLLTKFSFPRWLPDSRSFLIHRYPDVGKGVGSDTQALTAADLVVHRLDGSEEVLWENPGDPMLFTAAIASHDGNWLVQTQGWGTERTNSVTVYPLSEFDGQTVIGKPVAVVADRTAMVEPIRVDGDSLLALTDAGAPLGAVVRLPIVAEATPETVVAEGAEPIASAFPAGDGFLVERLVDVEPQLTRYAVDGAELGRIELAGGIAGGASFGRAGERWATYLVSTAVTPWTPYVIDTRTGQATRTDFARGASDFVAPELVVERHRAPSADGTEVPYWQIARAGTDLSAAHPTLVYGYGGFTAVVQPFYSAGWAAWVAAGGVLVICNLRGGSEFGQAWYDDGRRQNKQHVFDDVIAVGEDLEARGCAERGQLAVYGRSNGGLLAGAALTQRPDLWGAAVPQVGVLDLLRFHKFTGGLAWASDYGNPDVAEDFAVAQAYSPLHNVRPGTAYPPTLIVTGDHDDRVVPLHSHKFTATLQTAQAGEAPIVERIEAATGHGMGKPTSLQAAEWADILAFVAEHTGLRPT